MKTTVKKFPVRVPSETRDEFCDLLDRDDWEVAFKGKGKLFRALWNCDDQLGGNYIMLLICGLRLDEEGRRKFGGTYGYAVRLLSNWLRRQGVSIRPATKPRRLAVGLSGPIPERPE